MNEAEKKREKADLLLALHENEELIACLRTRMNRYRTSIEHTLWAMSGNYLKVENDRLKLDHPYPSEQEIVSVARELTRAEQEQDRLNELRVQMHL